MTSPAQIRPFESADWPGVWGLLEPVFRAGETFLHDPSITEAEAKARAKARALWVEQSQALLVALDASDTVVGSYYLRPNSLCLGAHLANAGYVVAEHCRRQGIGSWAMWMPMSWCKPSSEAGPPAAANNTACDSLPTEWQATV